MVNGKLATLIKYLSYFAFVYVIRIALASYMLWVNDFIIYDKYLSSSFLCVLLLLSISRFSIHLHHNWHVDMHLKIIKDMMCMLLTYSVALMNAMHFSITSSATHRTDSPSEMQYRKCKNLCNCAKNASNFGLICQSKAHRETILFHIKWLGTDKAEENKK